MAKKDKNTIIVIVLLLVAFISWIAATYIERNLIDPPLSPQRLYDIAQKETSGEVEDGLLDGLEVVDESDEEAAYREKYPFCYRDEIYSVGQRDGESKEAFSKRASREKFIRGLNCYNADRYAEAKREWQDALSLDPANTDAQLGLKKLEQILEY
ncbi:hypothetical protein Dip518_000424 [Parelusimicrobium proximum]|uniref:hypothetical protein n=1 Tax=Parelusimicrobium proximum TaxID=3228953 RepID=UPI003D178529